MNRNKAILILLIVVFVFSANSVHKTNHLLISYPTDWPTPVYDFEASPLNKTVVELGRTLFYDPILSADSTISCANCHSPYTAFTHVDHDLSHGIHDRIGKRNSPVLINLAWNCLFMWDGAINRIEVQGLAPITHPDEMGDSLHRVLSKLNRSNSYRSMAFEAFSDSSFSTTTLLTSLAQFQLTLVSNNSKYDQMKRGELSFSDQEQKGYKLFQTHCNSCHIEPLFTSGQFENNGLPIDTTLNDLGRFHITLRHSDSLKFKVPTLRNIRYSFPYMHDGRFQSIREVLDHYSDGIQPSTTLSKRLKEGILMTDNEKSDLTAFLLTLTDKEFLFNPKHGFPKK